jgi:hypothetical protein
MIKLLSRTKDPISHPYNYLFFCMRANRAKAVRLTKAAKSLCPRRTKSRFLAPLGMTVFSGFDVAFRRRLLLNGRHTPRHEDALSNLRLHRARHIHR